ncbi:hypothetical protein PRZ48_013541 [Zasmidium cellare]|uniref:Palmitoyltransferase n=1 Tax=Zasmidium cellare TaxID=395010 RepID=A0ABR0E1C5_ZASCE|nr:hypothetical protein PRZ48_013541 [Zasmidium cellare]
MANFSDPNDRSSAFPTFLGQDPYPATRDGRPTTSSSNATSEFETNSNRYSNIASSTGPVGEPGLPPSRPQSNATNENSYPRASSRASYASPPSRRGFAPFARREGDGSRPNSAINPTHVPSLTAQGFFRPMSPQKLQAQRGQAVLPPASRGQQSGVLSEESLDEEQETDSRSHRYSNASVNTARDRPQTGKSIQAGPLPTSRGMSIGTSSGGDGSALPGPESVVSKNSVTPLNTRLQQPDHSKLGPINGTPPPKSPRSFRASLGIGSRHSSKRDIHDRKPSGAHEKLYSNPSTPVVPTQEKKPVSNAMSHGDGSAKGKNYEYFAGNMLFFLSGRCLNTKAKPLNVATFILTALPAALFFGFSAPWLWHHVSPAIPIVFAYIFYVTISAFLHAAFSDPGILPRNLHPHPPNPDEDRDPLTVGPATTEWVMVKTFPSPRKQASPQSGAENGVGQGGTTAMEVPTKYCKSCSIWRPPRAHHCRICDACIETQDHHCVWLNNCVGRRNYRYFFAYVGFSSVMAILLLAFSLTHIAMYADRNDISFGSSLSGRTQERVAFAMFIYSVLALPYPGSLFVYHLFLIARGETTREYLNSHKFLPKDRHRPFSQQSFAWNWAAVLGRPRPPSYMSFKHAYAPGDVRLGHTMPRKERKEQARLEAARSNSRVEGLKQRYSVQKSGKSATDNGNGVEMQQLSPTDRQQGHDLDDAKLDKDVEKSQKPPPKPTGALNSTPR